MRRKIVKIDVIFVLISKLRNMFMLNKNVLVNFGIWNLWK